MCIAIASDSPVGVMPRSQWARPPTRTRLACWFVRLLKMPKKKKKKGGGKKKAASSKGSRGRSSKSSKRSKSRSKSSKRSKRKKSRSKTPTQANVVVREDPLDAQINHGPRSVLNLSCLNINRRMGATILEIALPYVSHWKNFKRFTYMDMVLMTYVD